ncbi:MAG: cyclodeaminase/cyclohydrolase family protein [Desulfobacteraceae bacterium]|nr:cyclodeaminase/cyclohydrolase family protein [Desulfobacteraceae bacterium]
MMALIDLSLKEFNKELSSKSPAPGGGSVAALCGAIAAALCQMVANLSAGEKYKDAQKEIQGLKEKTATLENELLRLVDKDTNAYNTVIEAFRLPKNTESEKEKRQAAIQKALKLAAQTPFDTLETVYGVLPLVQTVIEKGNPNCITDAGMAVELIGSAAQGAAYNVFINLETIKDKLFTEGLGKETLSMKNRIFHTIGQIRTQIETSLKMG